MEHTDQAHAQFCCLHLSSQIIFGCDQIAVMTRRIFAGVWQGKDFLHLALAAQKKTGTLFRVGVFDMSVDLVD